MSCGIAFGEDSAAQDLCPGVELTSDYATIRDSFRTSRPAFDSLIA
jgi:hypothetical protein